MFKSFLLELNISAIQTNYIFSVNSNDLNTIRLDLVIKDNAVAVDLTGKIVRLAIKKPDNKVVFQSGGVTDGPGGKCEFILEKQASLVAGRHEAEVMIYEGDSTVAVTTKFYYEVKRAVLTNEDVESTSDFPAISQAIAAGEILKDIDITSVVEAGERVEGIQTQLDAARQKEDGTLFGTLPERLNDSESKIQSNTDKIVESENMGEVKGTFWEPPPQPAMPWGANGAPESTDRDPEKFITGMYEPGRLANPDYITRTLLGKDQSGLYNVYRYELTPENYTSTIIISAGTHGNEYTAEFVLPLIYQYIINGKSGQWRHIRKNVRVIIHPMINPWSFANNKRQNFRGVDLNRNMDILWDYITGTSFQPGGTYYKGTAPFSEVETQYMRDSFVKYSDALAYIDFHTINTIQANRIVFTPRYEPQFREIFEDTISRLLKPTDKVVNGNTAMPTIAVHAAVTHKMTTANPEWYNGNYGGNRDSLEMTEAMRWFANVVIKASALEHKTTQLEESEPFTKLLIYNKLSTPTPITHNTTVYGNVTHGTYDMIVKRHGIMHMIAKVSFTLTAPATVGVNPIIYQVNHPELGFTEVKDKNYNEDVRTYAPGTYTVTCFGAYHVFPHNFNETTTKRPEQVKFRLRMKTSDGLTNPITIESWRVKLDFEPTNRGRAFEIIDFAGKESLAEGSDFAVLFPDPTKYGNDIITDENAQ